MLYRNRLQFPRLAGLGLLMALVLVAARDVRAQSRVATSAAPFLTMGTGARGSALGHAYTALATGADALYWNPAGASRSADPQKRGSAFFSHTQWLVDVDYNAFGLVIPVGAGNVGLQLAQVNYGRMDVTTVNLPEGTGESFGASDLVVGLSYARPLTNTFHIGGSFKYVRQGIYDMTASTMAFDIGFVLETNYLNGIRLGASIMNFGGQMQMEGINSRVFVDVDEGNAGSNDALAAQLETRQWSLPLSFKFGVALPLVRTNNVRVELYNDIQQTNDNLLNNDSGAEMRFSLGSLNFDLRTGYKDLLLDQVDSHMTYGAGLDLDVSGLLFGADFAYVPYEDLGRVSMIDFSLSF